VDFQRHAIAAANVEVLARDPVPAVPARADWGRLLTSNNAEGAVLLALPFLTIGGAERVFEMITRALIQAGRRVVIITTLVVTEGVIDNTPHFETITPHVYPLPTLFGENTAVWDDFVSYLISRYSVETILIAGCDYMYQLLPDLMSTFPDVSIVDQLFNDQVHFPTNRHFSRYIDVTVVPTQKFADRIRDEFGEDPERVAVVPHGVEVPPVPDDAAIVGARKESGLPAGFADKFLIGFFGRMSPEKAPADFVEIAANLADDPAVAFVMTGEGPEFGRVRQSIVEHGLMNRIHTPGFVANVHELLKAVDVVVVPSTLDGMPLIVMEAQALAKPVVASTVGSIPAMIRDRETGFLCIPRDIAAFAARIRELHASPEVRATVGAKARRSVETQYGAEAMLTSYLKLFQAAVDHRHTPADHPHSSKRQPDQRPGREQSSLR
jgi:glycosyltransferase involved in cell wall biosynthesis